MTLGDRMNPQIGAHTLGGLGLGFRDYFFLQQGLGFRVWGLGHLRS